MKKLKLRTRFFIYHTGIILLILISLILYIHKVVVSEMKLEDEQHFQLMAKTTALHMDNFFHQMDDSVMKLSSNPEIIDIFRSIPEDGSGNYFQDNPGLVHRIRQLIDIYNIKRDQDIRVFLYNEQGDHCSIFVPEPPTGTSFTPITTFSEMEAFFQGTGSDVFFHFPPADFPASKASSYFFAAVRPVPDYTSRNAYGYVEIWEPIQEFEAIFSHLGKDNYADILSSDNEVLYTSMDKSDTIDYSKTYQLNIPMEHAPCHVDFHKRPLRLEQELKEFYLMLGFMICAILTAVLSWERVMFRYLSSPLHALDTSLKSVAIDNLSIDITDENSEDILISLERSFNSMLSELERSIQLQATARANEAKAQQLALQSQMNPHFFHNILSIISMEAELEGNQKIPYICKELCGILRYNSQMGDGLSTIQAECVNAESYMLLMKTRYENLFEYDICIENGAGEISIPKLVIQPLCENCFKHGFKKIAPIWQIHVHAWIHEYRWYILIEDNGSGFSPDFLNEFECFIRNMEQKDILEILDRMSIGGLCIPNIFIRMKMLYQEDFTFEMKNTVKGASILLGGRYND